MIQKSITTVLALVLALLLTMCTQKKSEPGKSKSSVDAGFKEYVSAYTTGTVKAGAKFRIELTEAYKEDVVIGEELSQSVFSFKPAIAGKTFWISSRSIEFVPDKPLQSGQLYHGSFHLSELMQVKDELKVLPMTLQVIKQSFRIETGNLKPYDEVAPTRYKYEGVLWTADVMADEDVERFVIATQQEQSLTIQWQHFPDESKHVFIIEDIQRKEEDDEMVLTWNGQTQNIDIQGVEKVEVPGLSNFKLIDMKVFHLPEQYLQLTFSEVLKPGQNLAGLITIDNKRNLKYQIDGNQVKVFPEVRLAGTKQVIVSRSVRDIRLHKMANDAQQSITFELMKPNVRLLGKGIIIPDAEVLTFPFEAVNLSAIDVSVIKIYENNIAQFLQVNKLSGNYQLKRVGKLIRKKKIELTSDKVLDYGKWNTFSLDLAELIHAEQGAIYRVELSFKKAYSLYPCGKSNTADGELPEEDWNETEEAEISAWDNWEYYGSNYYNYNWREREDPCTQSYYRNKKVGRNILASDLGIIAKAGKDNKLLVAVTDLKTTIPQKEVDILLYNYQQQLITKVTTDAKGMASIPSNSKPFLLVAQKGTQRGYLKLSDGESLSLSKFDVGGAIVQRGVKGMIYGERGVWRPGDSIYTTFILEDKLNVIPDNHPVIFELIDPQGKITERKIKASGMDNFYAFKTRTKDDAPTGNWLARVRVGNVVFSKMLKIETVKPNRLKVNLDFGVDRIKLTQPQINGSLVVKWLHGAIAGNLKARVDISLKKMPTQFSSFKAYEFDDPYIEFLGTDKTIFEGMVDEKGEATVNAAIKVNQQAPGMLKATFLTKVFEKGGDFSIDQFSIPSMVYESYVGLKIPKGDKSRGMLLTDTDHLIEVVTVDPEGQAISLDNVKVEIYKLKWRWWWSAGSDNLASYIGRTRVIAIQKSQIDTKNGHGSVSFKIKYPDWGRYFVRVISPDGHSCGKIVYVDWPGWAGRSQSDNPGGASMLIFNADKKNYEVGETAELQFPSTKGGRALVSIESGSSILQQFWAETEETQTKVSLPITSAMAPNVYVSITLLQPHAQSINDLPIRMYGIIPLLVNDPETVLKPVIRVPDHFEPEKEANILVTEANGRPMTFTLAVVDEGLLDLTRFKTPDPWHKFYAREALRVKSWDMYDEVFGAFGGSIEQVFAIGGDEDLMNQEDKKAKRFKPVVQFFGPYTLKADGRKEIAFQMPRYVGSVRTMVVAARDNAYGSAEKATPVKSPLMLLATLPRVLGPKEKVQLPVTIFAMDESIKEVSITVKTNNKLKLTEDATKTIHFDAIGEKDEVFMLEVSDLLGIGTVELVATSGSHQASYAIELDVRPPNPEKTVSFGKLLQPGESWEQALDIFGIEGTNSALLEISGMPAIDLNRRMRYLMRYPYGCIEQTTSAVFPQLYLTNFVAMNDEVKATLRQHVEDGIERLLSFQLRSGGFSYWPGRSDVSNWGSSYAGHFMLEAERRGYALPYGLKENWLAYQKRAANSWNEKDMYHRSHLMQAYRLYTLALANQADLGAMNRLKELDNASLQSKYMLALTYAISGNKAAARDLIDNLNRIIKPYNEWSYTYGSSNRDQAIVIETLLSLEMFAEAMPMIKRLAADLNSSRWMSTQTTAFCLRTMAVASERFKESADQMKFSYTMNDAARKDVVCTQLINQYALPISQNIKQNVSVKNTSDNPLYVSLSLSGIPLTDHKESVRKNLHFTVQYLDMDGHEIAVDKMEQGTDFVAKIQVTHPALLDNYREMALTTIFPSGWEIINSRLFNVGEENKGNVPTYQDFRDDRVDTFFDLAKNRTKTFYIHLNAAYCGEYQLPAVECGAMYDNEIVARNPGKTIRVVRSSMMD